MIKSALHSWGLPRYLTRYLLLSALLSLSPHALSNTFHPDFPLINTEGQLWQQGDSISESKSCGQCHNSELIHNTLDEKHSHYFSPQQRLFLKLGINKRKTLAELKAETENKTHCLSCHSSVKETTLPELVGNNNFVAAAGLSLSSPDSENCGNCHGLVSTEDNSPLSLPNLQQDSKLFGLNGEIFAAQDIGLSALNLANKNTLNHSFDAHAERLLGCTDCHSSPNNPTRPQKNNIKNLRFDPRRLSAHEYLQQPNHSFEEALACQDCHEVKSSHQWLPYLNQHLNKLSCESCHISWLPSPAYQSITIEADTAEIQWRGIENSFITGYQPWLLPDASGKIKPFNIFKIKGEAEKEHSVYAAPLHHSINSQQAIKECRSCHDKNSILLRAVPAIPDNLQLADGLIDKNLSPRLAKADIYLIGGNTLPAIDILGLLLVLGTTLAVSAHGLARYIAAKRIVSAPARRTRMYIYGYYERLWHWLQAAAVLALLATGAVVHKPWLFPWIDFALMVELHNILGFVLFVNAALALFYHLASGEIKQYIPMPSDLFVRSFQQLHFYLKGMFNNEHHPFEKDRENKLNPLQKIAYFGLLNVLLPAQMFSGLLMWGAQTWPEWASYFGGLPMLGPLHSMLAWVFASFLIMHIYLTTTSGPKPLSGIKSMIDGWEEVETQQKANEHD
ncbi:Thiosulfate reductase cytochrome b subunit [Alteromonadaceae bacterium Bs31]|nr:Thiosulfate reductase cytochrome b subunit [Alteromonadaceae bacterium Bs31]